MRIPCLSGLVRSSPSIRIEPSSGRTKPAMMFISVDLPQPEGPTIATNSPSPTDSDASSTTASVSRPDGNDLRMPRTSILVRISPPHHAEAFEKPHHSIEQKADQADDDHRRDHQIVAVAGVARVDDQEAETRAQRDHLGRNDDQPRDAEPDAHADDDLRQHGRDHDAREQRVAR